MRTSAKEDLCGYCMYLCKLFCVHLFTFVYDAKIGSVVKNQFYS